MPFTTSQEERDQESASFEAERKRAPELFVREPMVDDDAALRLIGIEDAFVHRPLGYTSLEPQDFIVEADTFVVTIRLAEQLTPAVRSEIEEKIAEARQAGFWNFYYFQHFGAPRLLGHTLGRLLLRGEYEETIKTFLTYPAGRELPYLKGIRSASAGIWGDWSAISEKMDPFPEYFILERTLLHHLLEKPNDFLGALRAMPDQATEWLSAYDEFLFNQKLSALIREGEVPLSLPLFSAISGEIGDQHLYKEFLEADSVIIPSSAKKDFDFIKTAATTPTPRATLQRVEVHGVIYYDRVVALSFSLPNESLATNFLTGLFSLASDLPLLPGIFTGPVNVQPLLSLKNEE